MLPVSVRHHSHFRQVARAQVMRGAAIREAAGCGWGEEHHCTSLRDNSPAKGKIWDCNRSLQFCLGLQAANNPAVPGEGYELGSHSPVRNGGCNVVHGPGLNQDNDKNPLPLKCTRFSFLPKPRKFSFESENRFVKGFGVGSFQKRQRVFSGNKEEGFSPRPQLHANSIA